MKPNDPEREKVLFVQEFLLKDFAQLTFVSTMALWYPLWTALKSTLAGIGFPYLNWTAIFYNSRMVLNVTSFNF